MADGLAVTVTEQADGPRAGLRQYSSGFADGDDYLRLHFNESPYGPPRGAIEAAAAELSSRAGCYPDPECLAIRTRIARHHGVTPDMVAVANGTDELIMLTCLTFAARGGQAADVIVTDRTFPGYRSSATVAGAPVRTVPMPRAQIPVPELSQALGDRPGLAFVCSPHNPSGAMLDAQGVRELAAAAAAGGGVLVLDEAYIDFADPDRDVALALAAAGGRLIVLRTFSKAWGLASLRIGYAVGPADLISQVWRTRNCLPFDVNRLAQHAATAALDDAEHIPAVRRMTADARELMCKELDAIGVGFAPSSANFVMVSLDADSTEVAAKLASRHRVLVRDLAPFGLPGRLRVTVGTPDQASRFCVALADVLGRAGLAVGRAVDGQAAERLAAFGAVGSADAAAAQAPLTPTTMFNGYVGAQVFYALHELGMLRRLEQGPAAAAELAGTADQDRAAALLRAMTQLGFLTNRDGVVALTGQGRDLLRQQGYFIWCVGGNGGIWANLAGLTDGSAKFGRDVHRNDAKVATGAAAADRLLMRPVQDRLSAKVDFRAVADVGCGDGSRLLHLCGGGAQRRGLGIDISPQACELARRKVTSHAMADRIDIVQADVLDLLSSGRAFEGIDLVVSIFMLHDLFASTPDHAGMMRSLRRVFPDAGHFLLADTAMRGSEDSGQAPIFSLGFELAHAFMGVELQTRQTYEAAFEAAGLRLVERAPFGAPSTWLYLLEAT